MDLDDYTKGQYEKMLKYAILGYQELNIDSINSIKVQYLTMTDLNTVDLPNDYLQYYKVGMRVGGRVWNLGLNNDIALPREIACGDDSREIFERSGDIATSFGFFYTDHFDTEGNFIGGLFGFGGGYREAHFREDKERHQLVFDSTVPRNEIVLEYKSSGISAQTMVPRAAINCVVAYIHWRRLKSKRREAERREAEREFKEEKSLFRAYLYRFNASEYLDMLHSEMIQSPKR